MNTFCFYKYCSMIFFIMGGSVFFYLSLDCILILDWEFISVNSHCMVMTILVDWMSMIFINTVLFISSMVVYYSSPYMLGDVYRVLFLFLVVMFVFSMLMMIISPNMISILMSWDGLGLVSFLLLSNLFSKL